MLKYRAGGYGVLRIEAVEVVKETEKTVTIRTEQNWGGGKTRITESRENKISNYHRFFDTWEEAHDYLVKRAEKAVENCRMTLERLKGECGRIKGMKKEQP
jgi:hypothetical protein